MSVKEYNNVSPFVFLIRFFFELMVKSMIVHLDRTDGLESLRKMRFSHQFADDVQNLTASITNEIIAIHNKDAKDTRVGNRYSIYALVCMFVGG